MATTGAVWNGVCYGSSDAAADAYFSGAPVAQSGGVTSYVNQFVKESGVWKLKAYVVSDSGVWSERFTSVAQVPGFAACDPSESFFDGMAIGWGIATALVFAAVVKFVNRGAR